jgi:NADH-quinone oxidoreductase subunit N
MSTMNWLAYTPELIVLAGVAGTVVLGAWTSLSRWWPAAAGTAAALLALLAEVTYGRAHLSLGAHLHQDGFAIFIKVVALIAAAWIALLSGAVESPERLRRGFSPALVLGAALGAMIAASAVDTGTVFVAVLVAAGCIALHLRLATGAGDAAVQRHLLALASGVLLVGAGLLTLYGASGHAGFVQLAPVVASQTHLGSSLPLLAGLVLILIGLSALVPAVPLHAWVPEVSARASGVVTPLLLSLGPVAAFAVAARVLRVGFAGASDAAGLFAVAGMVSLLVAALHALTQANPRRLLAYACMAQAGFLLIALGTGSSQGVAAGLLLLAVLVPGSALASGSLALIAPLAPAQDMRELSGLADRTPGLALSFTLGLLSVLGMPPLVGSVARLWVLAEAARAAQVWLVVLALVSTIACLYGGARLLRAIYAETPHSERRWRFRGAGLWLAGSAGTILLLALLFVGPLSDIAHAGANALR